MTSTPSSNRIVQASKVRVDDIDIHYTKVGFGDHVVLLLPGFMGTGVIDFGSQLRDMCIDSLTLIAWDAPGCGKSRPPNKVIDAGYVKREAVYARNMMLALGYSKFSLVAWCNGGFMAMEIAGTYPENVRRLITIGTKAFYTDQDLVAIRRIHRIENQSKWRQVDLLDVYDENYVNDGWYQLLQYIERKIELHDNDICKGVLPLIRAPTLLLHGDRDVIVSTEHAFYLHKHIAGSRLKIMADSSHVTHIRRPTEYNAAIFNFLTNKEPL